MDLSTIELDPNSTFALQTRGAVHKHLNNFPLALTDLNRALEGNSDSPSEFIFEQRASVHQALGNYEMALADLDKVLKINPNNENSGKLKNKLQRRLKLLKFIT